MRKKVSLEEYKLLKSIQGSEEGKPITEEQYQLLKKHKNKNVTLEPVPGSDSLNPKDLDKFLIEAGKKKVLYQKRHSIIIGIIVIIIGIVLIALDHSDKGNMDGNSTAYGSVLIFIGFFTILWGYIFVYLVNKYPWVARWNTFFGRI